MKAKKAFRFAHGGHTVKDYPAGAELPADAAQWAVENGYAQIEDKPIEKIEAADPWPIKRGRKK